MRTWLPQVLAFAALAHGSTSAAAGTHCLPSEKIIFNCEFLKSKKLASVCASKNLTKTEGYLQYRFGKPGKLELVYPATRNRTQQQFYWNQLHPYQSFINELSFKSGNYLYTVAGYGISEELNGIPGGADFGQVEITKVPSNDQPKTLKCDAYTQEGMWDLGAVVNEAEALIVR
jgi:hypothetical protein